MRQVENGELFIFTSETNGLVHVRENTDTVKIELSVLFVQPSANFLLVH